MDKQQPLLIILILVQSFNLLFGASFVINHLECEVVHFDFFQSLWSQLFSSVKSFSRPSRTMTTYCFKFYLIPDHSSFLLLIIKHLSKNPVLSIGRFEFMIEKDSSINVIHPHIVIIYEEDALLSPWHPSHIVFFHLLRNLHPSVNLPCNL